MDIDFFKETGEFGEEAPNHGNFTFVTTQTEANYLAILHTRGFLDGMSPTDALASAERQWNVARPDLPEPVSTTSFSQALTLPVGTEVHLSLVNDLGIFWGKATLAGQSINAARKEIAKYLAAGRYIMAHSGGVALFNHIVNTPLRDSLKIAKATAADLDKPLRGTLYFRAVPAQPAPLPVAPDAKGQTKLSSWQDDVEAFVDQGDRALQEIRMQSVYLAGDLHDLDSVRRVVRAIWDIGMIGQIRQAPDTDYASLGVLDVIAQALANKLCLTAHSVVHDVIAPAVPGGHFGFDWTLATTEAGKTFAWTQTRRADPYKALADNVKKAPAAYIRLATTVCDLEAQMLWERAGDGDKDKVLRAELESAADWLDTRSGDPPDAAGGAGILLGMLSAIPPGIPRPPGLVRLAMQVTILHGILSSGDGDAHAAREKRLKGAVGGILDLPHTWIDEFRQSGTWDFLLSAGTDKKAATILQRGPTPTEKAAKNLIKKLDEAADATAKQMAARVVTRIEQMERAAKGSPIPADRIVLALAEETDAVQPAVVANAAEKATVQARLDSCGKVSSFFRVVGFLASAWQIGDDISHLLNTNSYDDAVKLAKDAVSAFGSYARDYVNARLALDPTLTPAQTDLFVARSNGFFVRKVGNALGVASALWTGYDAIQKQDPILGGAAACNFAGYGVRMMGWDLTLFEIGPLALELSVPLIAAGAALEIWANAQPAPPDETFKKQTMNMLRGIVHELKTWYERRHEGVPWRAKDVPELEAALDNLAQYADACEGQQKWSVFLTCDVQDAASMREVLARIGFSSGEASQLVADESAVKYAVRGQWSGLPISQRQWKTMDF